MGGVKGCADLGAIGWLAYLALLFLNKNSYGRQASHDFIVDLGVTHVPMDTSNVRPKRACRVMDLRSQAVPSL